MKKNGRRNPCLNEVNLINRIKDFEREQKEIFITVSGV